MNANNAGFIAMVSNVTASDSVDTLASYLVGSGNMRKRTIAALVALCATMTGANKAGEVITAAYILESADAPAAAPGEKAERLNAVSAYVEVTRKVKAAGHAFTISQRTVDGERAWVGAERSATEAKSKAASGARERKVSEPRADLTDGQALRQIRALFKLASTSNRDTVAAVAALLQPVTVTGKLPRAAAKRAA